MDPSVPRSPARTDTLVNAVVHAIRTDPYPRARLGSARLVKRVWVAHTGQKRQRGFARAEADEDAPVEEEEEDEEEVEEEEAEEDEEEEG